MNSLLHKLIPLLQEITCENDDRGGSVSDIIVLTVWDLDGRMNDGQTNDGRVDDVQELHDVGTDPRLLTISLSMPQTLVRTCCLRLPAAFPNHFWFFKDENLWLLHAGRWSMQIVSLKVLNLTFFLSHLFNLLTLTDQWHFLWLSDAHC